MAREEDTGKTQEELEDRVWELAESIRYCIFTTWDGERQRARPLDGTVERNAHAVYFLTDVASEKVDQLREFPQVSVSFADVGSFKFVVMSGTAKVTNDRKKIKDIWTATSKAWWDSPDDPNLRLVTFTPEKAELWDSRNKFIAAALMLTAAITGAKVKTGDHAKVDI